jgi:hypothetical protein
MMSNSECLEDGFFFLAFDTSSDSPRRPYLRNISMPNLRLLRLKLVRPRKAWNIFSLFRLPALEELCLERGEVGTRRNMGIYRKLLSESRVTLKRLILNEFALPNPVQSSTTHFQRRLLYQAVDGLLQLLENVTALHLSTGVYLNPTTLEQLSTGKFLPMLDTFEISTLNGWDIVSMVERRNTICKHGISSSSSQGPQFRALVCLYLFVDAYDMDQRQRGHLEVAVAALDLAVYGLGFAQDYAGAS